MIFFIVFSYSECVQKLGRCARPCPTERSKISLLEDNSLEIGTGNFIAQSREFIETSREFAASSGNCPPRHRFSRNSGQASQTFQPPNPATLGSSQASPLPVGRRLILGFRAGEIPGASITTSGITWPLGRTRAFRGRVAPKYAFVNRLHRIARPLGASLMGES